MGSKKKRKTAVMSSVQQKRKRIFYQLLGLGRKLIPFLVPDPCNVSDLEVPIDNLKNKNNKTKDYQIEVQQQVDIEEIQKLKNMNNEITNYQIEIQQKVDIQDMEVEKLEKIKDGSITVINAVDEVKKNVISMFCKPSTI